jgi:hypothetical protein
MGNGDEGNVIWVPDVQQRVVTHSDGLTTTVNAGLINTGWICNTNAYLQAIAHFLYYLHA